jgi:hypothetical protein
MPDYLAAGHIACCVVLVMAADPVRVDRRLK